MKEHTEHELTEDELENAAGGRRTRRIKGETPPPDADKTTAMPGATEPLPDPPFQA